MRGWVIREEALPPQEMGGFSSRVPLLLIETLDASDHDLSLILLVSPRAMNSPDFSEPSPAFGSPGTKSSTYATANLLSVTFRLLI